MKKLTEMYVFDQTNFDIEKNKLDINLSVFLQLENSFENITGSKQFLTIEALDKFIISKSGFPNVDASVKLLDIEPSYQYIIKFINDVVLEVIDLDAKTTLKQVINEVTEKWSYRLTDDADADYKTLLEITKMYAKLINPQSIHAIETYDHKVYNVNLIGLNLITTQR
jgi:hypothetical protein